MVRQNSLLLTAAIITMIAPALPAFGQGTLHARVSFDAGGTMVRGTEDADWAHATVNTLVLPGDTMWIDEGGTSEVEFTGGTFVRMADGSKVEMYALPPQAELRAWTGSFYVHRINRSTGDFTVQTPAGSVRVERDTTVRIDVFNEGSTTVSVRWGRAIVDAGAGEGQVVSDRQRVYLDPGLLPSVPVPFDASVEDSFDAWSRERAEVLATGITSVPETISVAQDTLGMADLSGYGDWVNVDNRQYWRPTVSADFVPYRQGHWSYVPSVGHSWVDRYPFGYTTSHYGRWHYTNNYGWLWSYDSQWSPAWVATLKHGNDFLWAPVDYDNRPVLVSAGATFNVGGIQFSVGASSFVPQDRLYYPTYVAPVRPTVVQNINVTNVNIWNINARNNTQYVNVPYRDSNITVVDYRPKTVVRGPDRFGKRNESAARIAQTLERRTGKTKFKAVETASQPTAQTAVDKREKKAKTRDVRIDSEQKVARSVPAPKDKERARTDRVDLDRGKARAERSTDDAAAEERSARRERIDKDTPKRNSAQPGDAPTDATSQERAARQERDRDRRTERQQVEGGKSAQEESNATAQERAARKEREQRANRNRTEAPATPDMTPNARENRGKDNQGKQKARTDTEKRNSERENAQRSATRNRANEQNRIERERQQTAPKERIDTPRKNETTDQPRRNVSERMQRNQSRDQSKSISKPSQRQSTQRNPANVERKAEPERRVEAEVKGRNESPKASNRDNPPRRESQQRNAPRDNRRAQPQKVEPKGKPVVAPATSPAPEVPNVEPKAQQ